MHLSVGLHLLNPLFKVDDSSCGANCVKTCENVYNLLICTLECAPGCTCPDDTYLHEGRCVTADQCPSKYATLCKNETKINF